MRVGRVLLARRRIDAVVLAIGIAGLTLMASVGKAAFVFFAVCGLYLALARPRSLRAAPHAFMATLVGWAVWQIALSLLRGEPIAGNRLLSYAGLELACAFLPIGLCLVARPGQILALGARAALLVLLVSTPLEYAITGARVGLGGNEAIFGFMVGAAAVLARLPTDGRFRYLPDGLFWTYLATVPIVLSGTRAAMLLILIVAVLDLRRLLPRLRAGGRRTAIAAVGALVVASLASVPLSGFVAERVESGLTELSAYEATGLARGSVDVRMAMWGAAVRVLAESPFVGVGGTSRMEAVAQEAGPNAGQVRLYQHLHNLVLDEALSSGLIGLALMSAVFVVFLSSVLRRSDDARVRDGAVALVIFSFVFGLFHGVLLNEWMILAIFGSMATILTELQRRRPFGLPRNSSE